MIRADFEPDQFYIKSMMKTSPEFQIAELGHSEELNFDQHELY